MVLHWGSTLGISPSVGISPNTQGIIRGTEDQILIGYMQDKYLFTVLSLRKLYLPGVKMHMDISKLPVYTEYTSIHTYIYTYVSKYTYENTGNTSTCTYSQTTNILFLLK